MATIAVGTEVQTEEILADEKVIDMDPKMRKLDPDTTQFDTYTRRQPSRAATREKVNWLEEAYVERILTTGAAGYSSGATSVPVVASGDVLCQVNDLVRNMRNGEMMRVTAVAPTALTVAATRVGAAPAAAGTSGDKLLIVGPALPQASTLPAPRYSQRVLGFNYTEIVRTTWQFSGTAAEIELYGGGEDAKEQARKAVEHKRTWEAIGFFGARDFSTISGSQVGAAGGAIEFIQTNKQNVGGELTSDYLDLFLATVLAKGSADKVIFTGTVGAYYISRFHRSGQGAFWAPSNERVHGVKVDGFISGVFGTQVPVIVKKEWADFPSGANGYNGNLFVLDMANIERRPLRNRDTKKIEYDIKSLGNGKDAVAGEYFSESTYTFAQEKTHGLLTGIA
jgi:hypothetical protein